MSRETAAAREGRERAALVGLITGDTRRTHVEDALDELAGLADAADIEPVSGSPRIATAPTPPRSSDRASSRC